jgi:uncharacterized protein (UPF0333 family)
MKASKNINLRHDSGQIVLEYVLLLVVAVSVATLITSMMVNRNPNSPGFLVRKWSAIITTIGKDPSDDLVPQQ